MTYIDSIDKKDLSLLDKIQSRYVKNSNMEYLTRKNDNNIFKSQISNSTVN